MKKPCKHIEAGSKDNGTGLCWACGANSRAATSLSGMDKALALRKKTFDRLLKLAKKLP